MEKRLQKRILLGQNFLKSPKLVRALVEASSIGPADTVLEIGGGRGIITAELAKRAEKVISIERDGALVRRLRDRFWEVMSVEIVQGDFLEYCIAEDHYKIFANIPYNITARILRKILFASPRLDEAYLIMQKEPARKFSGQPEETLISVLAKPFFDFRIMRQLRRTDFEPMPSVDSVLLGMTRREPMIGSDEYAAYCEFVRRGFQSWKPNLRSAYKNVLRYKQWKRLSKELGFPLNATPTELSFGQWLGLYRGLRGLRERNHGFDWS